MNFTERSNTSFFNLFYLFVCIIWSPLQIYVLHADAAGRTIMVLSALAVLLNLSELWKQKIFKTPAFRCWIVLLCFSLLNATLKGFTSDNGVFQFYKANFIEPLIILVIAMLELRKDRLKTMKVIWSALGIFLLIGFPFMFKYYTGRSTIEGLGNLYPLFSVTFLFVSAMLFVERKMKVWLFIVLLLFVNLIILNSGTRKAFGAEIIILIGTLLSYRRTNFIVQFIRIMLIGGLLFVGIRIAINNSKVGEQLIDRLNEEAALKWSEYNIQLVDNQAANDLLINLLDDRAIQYGLGLDLFREHFWTGIGLTNFINESGYPIRLHTEYMVQLCENGIIGFALLALFYSLIIKAFIKNKRKSKSGAVKMALFGLITILFINITTWTYCTTYAMIMYAIILTYAYSKNDNVQKTHNFNNSRINNVRFGVNKSKLPISASERRSL